MATMPTFQDGHVVTAAEWNDHATQINTNTDDIGVNASDISGLDSRLTTAEGDISSNDTDISDLDGRVTTLEGDAHPIRTQATDTDLYGDVINSHRRGDCYNSEVLSNGYMTAFVSVSPKTFTANEMRLCVTAAGVESGSGTFDIGFYKGTSLSNLVQQYTTFGVGLVDNIGMLAIAFDSGIAINEGDFVGIEMIATGWDTNPDFSSTPTGSNADQLMNATPYSVYEGSRSYPLDDPIDMYAASWTRSNQSYWFALA